MSEKVKLFNKSKSFFLSSVKSILFNFFSLIFNLLTWNNNNEDGEKITYDTFHIKLVVNIVTLMMKKCLSKLWKKKVKVVTSIQVHTSLNFVLMLPHSKVDSVLFSFVSLSRLSLWDRKEKKKNSTKWRRKKKKKKK